MSDCPYTSALKRACKFLNIVIHHFLHLGRSAGPAQCELEEVNGMDSRALGNWKQDVFAASYSTQLPLPAMRVMAGHDKRQGYHSNPRSTYFGDESHQCLPLMIFPWLDTAMEQCDNVKNKTAAAFLSFMESLRWVILQDAAIMLSDGREHYIFTHNPDIFNSVVFRDFKTKLLCHIEKFKRDDEFNATLDTVLPGVHNRLDNQMFAMHATNAKLNMMQRSITGVIRNYEDFKETSTIEKDTQLEKVDDSICQGFENVKNNIAGVFRKEVNQFIKHIGSYETTTGLIENGTDNDGQGKAISSSVNDNEGTLIVHQNEAMPRELVKTVQLYEMPKHFATFGCMMKHWYKVVKENENTSNKTWRKHLCSSDKKRFQRFARVICAYKTVLQTGVTVTEAENKFETYYRESKQSLASLSDKFAMEILE